MCDCRFACGCVYVCVGVSRYVRRCLYVCALVCVSVLV